MDRIKKYKIEDELLDDQEDNLFYTQKEPILNINQQNSQINNSVYKPAQQLSQTQLNDINNFQNSNFNNNIPKPEPPIYKKDINTSEANITNLEFNDDITNQENNENNQQINDGYHHVQIIDEDVENFKRRLDIMVKNFRTDTLKDFMAIKRNLLIEQKTCIENEKQKCDALLSSKSDLIEHLKDDLAKTQKALNSQIIIKEKLTEILFKKNHDKIIKNIKSLAFHGVLMKYHNKKKLKKDKIKKMRKAHWDKYKQTFFKNMKQNWKEMKIYHIVSAKEKACDDKLNEMAQYYGREINELRSKLNDANSAIEQGNQAKTQIQENLKKVLMRGVMAMNMEAMNVLDKDMLPKNDINNLANNILNNISNTNNNNTESNINNISNNNNVINSGINIKVGNENEDNNMQATVIPANQTFQPKNETFNKSLSSNMQNPINKESYWMNAPSVPMNFQNNINIVTTDNKCNRDAMINTINKNNNLNNNNNEAFNEYHDNDVENNNDDFEEELNSRIYNMTPMNPIDTKYVSGNHLIDNSMTIKTGQFNNNNMVNNPNNYYDVMQQNLLNIKNEFSAIKQNQSSMIEEDSFTGSYAINNYNNIPNSGYGKSSMLNNNTTNNTSKNNNSNSKNVRSNSKKGNVTNKKNSGNINKVGGKNTVNSKNIGNSNTKKNIINNNVKKK